MKRAVVGTGLTAREQLTPETAEEFHEVMLQVGRPTFMERLALYANDAKDELLEHGLPENAKHAPVAHDTVPGYAIAILRLVNALTAAVEKGTATPDALGWAFELGVLIVESRFKFKYEKVTIQGAKSHAGMKAGAKERAQKFRPRDKEMAFEFERQRRVNPLRRSDTALMEDIGKRHKLKRRAAIDAVKRGLKEIVHDRGKLHE